MKIYKFNTILNIIIIVLLVILGFIENTANLGMFAIIFSLSFPKIRNRVLEERKKFSATYEIVEVMVNIYLCIIIARVILDPMINSELIYAYLVLRLIYIICLLLLMNIFLFFSTHNKKLYSGTFKNSNYVLCLFGLLLSIVNLLINANIMYSLTAILCLVLLVSIRKDDKKILFFAILSGIFGIMSTNPSLILLPFSIGVTKYKKGL